jgi:hypothetical protein
MIEESLEKIKNQGLTVRHPQSMTPGEAKTWNEMMKRIYSAPEMTLPDGNLLDFFRAPDAICREPFILSQNFAPDPKPLNPNRKQRRATRKNCRK